MKRDFQWNEFRISRDFVSKDWNEVLRHYVNWAISWNSILRLPSPVLTGTEASHKRKGANGSRQREPQPLQIGRNRSVLLTCPVEVIRRHAS
jgi:hypothetical protein